MTDSFFKFRIKAKNKRLPDQAIKILRDQSDEIYIETTIKKSVIFSQIVSKEIEKYFDIFKKTIINKAPKEKDVENLVIAFFKIVEAIRDQVGIEHLSLETRFIFQKIAERY